MLPHCAFCPATEDLLVCDWPVSDFVRSTYGRLAVGDKVKRIADKTGRPAKDLDYCPAHARMLEVQR
jgi:hypothetical protein